MKYCTKCGTQCDDAANFCTECGAPLTHDTNTPNTNTDTTTNTTTNTSSDTTPVSSAPSSYTYGTADEQQTEQKSSDYSYNYSYNTDASYTATPNYNGNANEPVSYTGIGPRSIPVAIILSIVTCGIYGIYWMIKLNDEVNLLSGEIQATSGGIVFLLSLVTCGIYSFYWLYKMGERCDRIKGVDGNSSILYLIVGILGFSIIAYCLMQDTINKAL